MENQNHIKPKGPGKVGSKKGCGGGWAVDRKLAEGPCTNANPVTGSKNQKFEFRSRLQLRRIDVHINQLCNRHPPSPSLYTHTQKHSDRGAAVYSGAYGGVAVSRQSVKCGFVVAPLAPYPRCCVEFCKSSGNATQEKKTKHWVRRKRENRAGKMGLGKRTAPMTTMMMTIWWKS